MWWQSVAVGSVLLARARRTITVSPLRSHSPQSYRKQLTREREPKKQRRSSWFICQDSRSFGHCTLDSSDEHLTSSRVLRSHNQRALDTSPPIFSAPNLSTCHNEHKRYTARGARTAEWLATRTWRWRPGGLCDIDKSHQAKLQFGQTENPSSKGAGARRIETNIPCAQCMNVVCLWIVLSVILILSFSYSHIFSSSFHSCTSHSHIIHRQFSRSAITTHRRRIESVDPRRRC